MNDIMRIMNRGYNTKKQGTVEYLVFKEGNTFVGVCLTFDLVREGKDPDALLEELRESARDHINTVILKDMPEALLNRHAPAEYWRIYDQNTKVKSEKLLIKSPYSFDFSNNALSIA